MSETDDLPEPIDDNAALLTAPLPPNEPQQPRAAEPRAAGPRAAVPVTAPGPAGTRGGALWPLLGVVGFLLLAGGEVYLWRLAQHRPDQAGQLASLQAEITALQQQPAAAPATPAGAAAADASANARLMALTAQVNAIQSLFSADHTTLTMLQANAFDLGKITAQLNALQTEGAADHTALAALQADTADLGKLTAQVALVSHLDAARLALDAGQPLGNIPNAPPALSKFAAAPPPTEAALIMSFPDAARAAESASVTSDGKRSYWSTVLSRLEGIITISNGTHVVVGAPAAGVIEQAQAALDAGDLAGAVAVLDTLSLTTQAAMGDWLGQARDLLAARQAMVAMAGQP